MGSTGDRGRRRWTVTAGMLVVALLVVGALAVALGGGGCDGSGYPDSPDCVASEYARRTDPSKCDLVAPQLLEELTRARGAEARRLCAASVRASTPPTEVKVRERETAGDTVIVELETDGREGKLTLERSGGRWRIISFQE